MRNIPRADTVGCMITLCLEAKKEVLVKECFANIKPTDAVVVGRWDKQSDPYTINAGYLRKYV